MLSSKKLMTFFKVFCISRYNEYFLCIGLDCQSNKAFSLFLGFFLFVKKVSSFDNFSDKGKNLSRNVEPSFLRLFYFDFVSIKCISLPSLKISFPSYISRICKLS